MQLMFFTEARLKQTRENRYYSIDQSFSYQTFAPYLKVFDELFVVARTISVQNDEVDEQTRTDQKGVHVLPLPYYVGPYQYIIRKQIFEKRLRDCIDSKPGAAIICRVPGVIGTAAARYLSQKKRPFGLEVVGDPGDVFAKGAFDHFFRAFFRYFGVNGLKTAVKSASAVIFVTRQTLQLRYPAPKHVFSTHASNVILTKEAFAKQPKKLTKKGHFLILAVGTLSAMYKAPDIAVRSMAILKQRGFSVSLQWIGGGRYRPKLISMAQKAGVCDVVNFIGSVGSAAEMRRYMDGADLFVLPSRQEGLPRALVEAMARGLPCIGCNIGSIPELLDNEALIPVNDPVFLAQTILRFLTVAEVADRQANRNLQTAKNYAFELLEPRRNEFFRYVKGFS
jgi:glycosyltransferase involved in cell wall biosynthesis